MDLIFYIGGTSQISHTELHLMPAVKMTLSEFCHETNVMGLSVVKNFDDVFSGFDRGY